MNKIILFLTIISLLFSFVGCENKDIVDNPKTSSTLIEETTAPFVNPMEVVEGRVVKDHQNRDVLIVILKWTNTTNETRSYYMEYGGSAFQNGIGLERTYLINLNRDSEYDKLYSNQMLDVRPTYSIEIAEFYVLRDMETNIEYENSELFTLDGNLLISHTFDFSTAVPIE